MPRAHPRTSYNAHIPSGPNPTARRPLSKPDKPRPAPVPPHADFSEAQAEKAVRALLAHQAQVDKRKEEKELLGADGGSRGAVFLVVNTKRGRTRGAMKPIRIQLPHPPLPPPPASLVGLITKPPQRTYKDLLASSSISFVNRVVDTDKLRGKWKPFEARRNLCRENDVWLVDERVLPSAPGLLGKVWFDAKKHPIPVNLQRKDLKAELGRAIAATYYIPNTGTSHSIRISTPTYPPSSSLSTAAEKSTPSGPQETLSNLLAALPQLLAQIEGGWENVLSVGVKTGGSLFLPIWSAGVEGRFEKPARTAGEASEGAKTENKKKEKGKAQKGPAKRGAEAMDVEEDGEEVVPAKKAGKKSTATATATVGATAGSLPVTDQAEVESVHKSDSRPQPPKIKKTLGKAGKDSNGEKTQKKKSSTLGSGKGQVKKGVVGSTRA